MATSSPPAGLSNHPSITHDAVTATSSAPSTRVSGISASTKATDTSITVTVSKNSLPATDEARAGTSNSLLGMIADTPTSIEPMISPSSATGSFVQLHTPNNPSPTSLDTFRFFPKLVPELRLKIWSDALPDSRTVEVEVCAGSGNTYKWWASAESKHQPCGLLLASKESRYVYLKHWLPLFRYVPLDIKFSKDEDDRYQMYDIDVSGSQYPLCYFNPKVDMLYLGPYNPYPTERDRCFTSDITPFATEPLESLAAIPALQQLRRLTCQFGEWDEAVNGYPGVDNYSQNFLLFPSLEEFIIGVGDVGWEAMNLQENTRLRKTKANGQIELEEILRDEWASSDDPEGPTYFSWWWHGVRTNNSANWKAPSFSVKRVLRGGKRPQNSLTGCWEQLSLEDQRLTDELQSSTAAKESEENEEDNEII